MSFFKALMPVVMTTAQSLTSPAMPQDAPILVPAVEVMQSTPSMLQSPVVRTSMWVWRKRLMDASSTAQTGAYEAALSDQPAIMQPR